MQFPKEVEDLIKSALADGVLTQEERAALVKKCLLAGADPKDLNEELDKRMAAMKAKQPSVPPTIPDAATKQAQKKPSIHALDDVIQAYLTDGVITDKERKVLLKKAVEMGLDEDEFDLYIDAQQQKSDQANEAAANKIRGKICPNCGRQVPPLTIKCVCGYEFSDPNKVSSVTKLSQEIDDINAESGGLFGLSKQKREKRISDLIRLFPVPNTKEDIVEFLALSVPNMKHKGGIFGTIPGRLKILVPLLIICSVASYYLWGGTACFFVAVPGFSIVCFLISGFEPETIEWNKRAEVWRDKFDQVMMKGRSLRGDPDFQRQLDCYEDMVKKH